MAPRTLRLAFIFLALAAFGARCLAYAFHPDIHADEVYQYVDPATFYLRGVGWQTWEWRDGVRSWVLPAYHGAWLVLAGWLRVPQGLPRFHFVQLHWAAISSVAWVVVGAWGASNLAKIMQRRLAPAHEASSELLAPAALLGAGALALYPPLVPYGARTLSELPSALFLTFALVATSQIVLGVKKPWLWSLVVGITASTGVCLRVANGPLAAVPVLWLLFHRRWRNVCLVIAGALLPLSFFGFVDWMTWGKPFSSYIAYMRFNFIEGRAADFGIAPALWYAEQLWERAGAGIVAILLLGCLHWRATWPFVASGLGLLVYLSTQPHKEERFLLFLWPALLIPAAATVGHWLSNSPSSHRRLWVRAIAFCALCLALDGFGGIAKLEWNPRGERIKEAQAFVSQKHNVTGLLVEEAFDSGAYAAFAYNVPMLRYNRELLANPMFNYAVVTSRETVQEARDAGFVVLHRWGSVVAVGRK